MVAVLALVGEAIVLTFTRTGLVAMVLSMAIVGVARGRRRGWDGVARAGVAVLAIVVLEVMASHSMETLMLRFSSEGQSLWFRARIDAPPTVSLDTRTPIEVPLTLTNTGRATWDSDAAEPVQLSYHWVALDTDDVVAWEGLRTPFPQPVKPGDTVSVMAALGGPGRPGRFRLMWDLEQERRLWFSTETDAEVAFSVGDVSGPTTGTGSMKGPRRIPRMAVRPGRLVLWTAAWRMFAERPLVGVGLDNYRLLYGRYSPLPFADPRVHSNNMYIEVLAGCGLLGLTALCLLGTHAVGAALIALRTSALGSGIAAAGAAIALHGLVDSFLSFTGTYVLFAVTVGLASACMVDTERDAHRV